MDVPFSGKPRVGGSSPSWSIFFIGWLVVSPTKIKWSLLAPGPFHTGPVGAIEQRVRLLIWRLWVWVPHGVLFFCRKWIRLGWKKKCFSTPSGTRTHNLTLRRGAPCPLGHGGLIFSWQSSSAKLRPTNRALNQSRGIDLLSAVGLMVWFSIQVEEGMGSTLARSSWFFIFH